MQRALSRHDDILRKAIEERGGYVFKTVGDAFCCAFPTAPDALEAALETQRTLKGEEWEGTGPLRVRMALHTGVAEEKDGDYFGPPVNRVARLLSAAHGGQVLLSLPAQELVRDQLPGGTSLKDLGAHRLKDLFRPERVFQLLARELPSEFPPLRTLEDYRNNLPLQPTPLIGREKEVAEVCEQLSRPEVRLLTLTGAGGTGKTRLGLQAAAELTDEFEEGVFFVSLAAISDPQLVVGAVAGTLGVKEAGGQPLLESLKYYLDEKYILLMVDNFEQVLEAAPMVAELLSAAPNLNVLATSRIPLRLYGEHEYSVPPLALPDRERPPSVERLTHYEAVRLFVERAQAAKADFSVTNDNAPAVAEICYRLDGLPLAIELAAARIKVLSPQKMLDRLGNRLKLLTGGARDLPERQRTLRSTIEWSYGLLEEDEKALFIRLSVFAGGRTLEAIEAVCDVEGDLPIDVLDGLSSLVDKSLLKQEEGVGGELRFVMLETIHEFAREKLQESEESEDTRRLHAEYFLALAEEAEPELLREGKEEAAWLERLEAELDNMRAALSWTVEREDPDLGLRFAGALGQFWLARGYDDEARRWLEEALAKPGHTSASRRAKALDALGSVALTQNDLDRAEAAATEGLELGDRAGIEGSRVASFRVLLGGVELVRGDLERAEDLSESSLALSREVGDRNGVATALISLAHIRLHQEEYGKAGKLFEESLVVGRELDKTGAISSNLINLGFVSLLEGDVERAETLNKEAVALNRERGHKDSLPYALDNLGWTALARGDPERAENRFEECLLLCKDLNNRISATLSLEGLACATGARGEYERSARLLGAAEALREGVGYEKGPADRALQDPYLLPVRAELDEAAFAEGRTMTFEEAVEYALSTEGATTPQAPTRPRDHDQPPGLTPCE